MKNVEVSSFRMSLPVLVILMGLIAIGAIALYLIALHDPTRAWYNYLIGTCIFLGLGLCGFFFLLAQSLVRSHWFVVTRRIFECMAMTLPVAALLAAGVYFGRHHIYEWANSSVVAGDHLLQMKSGFLNEKFFGIRLILYFLAWIGGMTFVVRNSLRQDDNGDVSLTEKNYRGSALALILFAICTSLAGVDLLKSLEPHWFSTIYGIYFFAGFFQAGLATAYLAAWYLERRGVLKGFINQTHFHDLGKFVFAFSVFWAYIGFSQFMLYWYADLPEETFWYKVRFEDGWACLAIALVFLRWVIPFFVLLPYRNKFNFKISLPICLIVLIGNWVDLFWNAMPASRHMAHGETHGHVQVWMWQDVAVGLGFIAFFFLVLGLIMQKTRMLPIRDPRLEASLHHHF